MTTIIKKDTTLLILSLATPAVYAHEGVHWVAGMHTPADFPGALLALAGVTLLAGIAARRWLRGRADVRTRRHRRGR